MGKGGGHSKGQKMQYRVIRSFDHEKPFRAAHWTRGAAEADLRETLLVVNRTGRLLEASIVDAISGETVYEPVKCSVCGDAWATESRLGDETWSVCLGCEDVAVEPSAAELEAHRRHPSARPDGFGEAVSRRAVELPDADPPNGRIRLVPPTDGDAMIVGRTGSGKTSLATVAAIAEHVARTAVEQVNKAAGFESVVAPLLRPNALPDADPSALLAALDRLNIERAVWSDGTVAAVANGMLWTMQAEPHAVTGEPCGVWSVASPEAVRGHFVAEGAARFIRDRRTP